MADMSAAMDGLGALVGLAPSAVVQDRLARSQDLLPALDAPPGIHHPGWAALIDAVTVQETRLFRHARLMEELAADVLPGLAAAGRPLRIVSAGCATGEEAFSLAILAQEAGGEAGRAAEVIGLDISRTALAAAEQAAWPRGPVDPLRDVPARFRDLFEPDGARLLLSGPVRALVRFHRANLLHPPAELLRGADLILCRNVLIYLREEARKAVVSRLVDGLRPGGALVLGPTDSLPVGIALPPWRRGLPSVWRRP